MSRLVMKRETLTGSSFVAETSTFDIGGEVGRMPRRAE